ncbi:MAG: type II toxin-antitoxin system RelE/ParE family toxin [Planktothrix sp.]|uniref:type II toxin-antitoxin system RelE/ParE family toxin n=1 Tax=Planktothrix sp. TaxID=3088171 RepID=UPI0038D4DA44
METQPKEIRRYVASDGKIPFDQWFNRLRDRQAQYRIDLRLKKLQLGNLGDCRFVGEGVYELKIDYGPGYRIYFAQVGVTIILLLCGGDKSTQKQDIDQAQKYWKHYRTSENA